MVLAARPRGDDDYQVRGDRHGRVHGDGCGVCGRAIEPGDAFYLDVDAGDVLCADHGRERREGDERDGTGG